MTITNPNNPSVAGDEYLGIRPFSNALVSAEARGVLFPSTATETIDHIALHIQSNLASATQALIAVDVYDATSLNGGAAIDTIVFPGKTSNVPTATTWTQKTGTGGSPAAYDNGGNTAYTFVDNVIDAATDLTDNTTLDALTRVVYTPTNNSIGRGKTIIQFQTTTTYLNDADGTSASTTSKRIAYLDVVAVFKYEGEAYPINMWGVANIGGVNYFTDPKLIAAHAGLYRRFNFRFKVNPATGRRWTHAEIAEFDTAGSYTFGIQIQPTMPIGIPVDGTIIVISVGLRFNLVPETRVASATVAFGAGSDTPQWQSMQLGDPATDISATWAKLSGHNYVVVAMIASGNGGAYLATIDATIVAGHETDQYGTYTGQRLTLTDVGIPVAASVSLGSGYDYVPGFVLIKSGPAASVDGQPYVDAPEFSIDVSHEVRQRISNTQSSAHNYRLAAVVVARDEGTTAALSLQIYTVSGDTPVGGSATINPTDVPADGKFHQVVAILASNASLTGGTGYYLSATSSAAVGSGWRTRALLTRNAVSGVTTGVAPLAAAISANGTTDFGSYAIGISEHDDNQSDFPFWIGQPPTAPSGLTSANQSFANIPNLAFGNLPRTLHAAHLDWTSTSLGGSFAQYEVQRQLPDSSWATIAIITLEASSYFYDVEPLRNVSSAYRLRVVRSDGAPSDWASFPAVTVTQDSDCDLVLASNAKPTSTQALQNDTTSTPDGWTPLDRGDLTPILGRDDSIAVYLAEDGGYQFTRNMIVAVNDSHIGPAGPVLPGHPAFVELEGLLRDRTLPYVAYLDGYGTVFLVSALIQSEVRKEFGGIYEAGVQFTTVQRVPTAVVVATPWVP